MTIRKASEVREPRRLAVWGILATAIIAAGGMLLWGLGRDIERDGEQPLPYAVTLPPAPAAPAPSVKIPSDAAAIKPPSEVREALNLGETATMRDVLPIGSKNNIQCGEVSPTGAGDDYRRFVYIGSIKTGKVDDGSRMMRDYLAQICAPRAYD